MSIKKKYSQAARVQGILRTLGTRHEITIGELADEFEVTKRTVYRDLKALEDSGYPIFSEVIDGPTYWKLDPSFKNVPSITFTQNELMALYFSRKLFREGSPLKQDLESAYKKIESVLSAKHLAKLERIEEMFLPLAKMTRKVNLSQEIFEPIKQALLFQNPLKLEYRPRKSNNSFPFEVHPYSLLLYQGELYLLCYAPDKNGLRYFALDGIKKVERMMDRFEISESFSLEEFIKVPFGIFHGKPISVKVVFDSELSDYIKRRTWHPSQRIKELRDGRIVLSFTASGENEIKAWILSFGPKAKVLLPKSFRQEIEADLSKTLAHYNKTRYL